LRTCSNDIETARKLSSGRLAHLLDAPPREAPYDGAISHDLAGDDQHPVPAHRFSYIRAAAEYANVRVHIDVGQRPFLCSGNERTQGGCSTACER
jgi:hypothetical protein